MEFNFDYLKRTFDSATIRDEIPKKITYAALAHLEKRIVIVSIVVIMCI